MSASSRTAAPGHAASRERGDSTLLLSHVPPAAVDDPPAQRITLAQIYVTRDEPINCASGVVNGFDYEVSMPRAGEVIRTVEFTAAPK